MDALANKVEAFGFPFDVNDLEFEAPLEEKIVCHKDLIVGDAMLIDDADPPDELTEVRVVRLWKHTVKNSRTFTIEIVEKLPGFVTA